MKYFLPDSQDLVDPSFDFETERRSKTRLRQRDDQYAHELFSTPAYDGILVSKGIVDGFGGSGARYTLAQRHRLYRSGAEEFFRLNEASWSPLPIMGDCGAFTYVKEEVPPYSVDDVLTFYLDCGFQLGISVDHVILDYNAKWDKVESRKEVPEALRRRQEITLELARDFLAAVTHSGTEMIPLGVAQGWSPDSYAASVRALQKMGYQYIAVGGMVPLKTKDIVQSVDAIHAVLKPETKLHLLGITRLEQIPHFARSGVASFDSTSPLRQAFKDDKDNYYTEDREFTAIRIPQVEGNPRLQKAISSGAVKQEVARRLERECLLAMKKFDRGEVTVESVVSLLVEYESLVEPAEKRATAYRETLEARPWIHCGCDVCRTLGHHVILFRGAERNRRRGLHNTWAFYRRMRRALGLEANPTLAPATRIRAEERATS